MTPENKARRHVRGLIADVARRRRALASGDNAISRCLLDRARERYLNSADAKTLQFQTVNGTVRNSQFQEQPFEIAAELARKLDLNARYQNPVRFDEIRSGPRGKLRRIFDLPPTLRVAHRMAAALIEAQFEPQRHIYNWKRRGTARMLHDMIMAFEMGYNALLLADVASCYDSINFDAVYSLGLLPGEFVAAQLDMRRMQLVRRACEHLAGEVMGKARAVCPLCLSIEEREPVGQSRRESYLVQGSPVSNSLLAVLFDDLPRHLPQEVLVFVYGDNVALLARDMDELSAAGENLVNYYRHHVAGRLSLRVLFQDYASAGFEHVGYRVEREEERWSIALSDANFAKQCSKVVARYTKPRTSRQCCDDGFAMTRSDALSALHEFTAGFPALTADRTREVFEFLLGEEFNSGEDFPIGAGAPAEAFQAPEIGANLP